MDDDRKYLPDEQAKEQANGFSTGSWVKEQGEYVSWKTLLDALKTYGDNYDTWSATQCKKHWLEKIGGTQKLLPMHVLQEYCQPDRPFDPVPNFKADYVLERALPSWLIPSKLVTEFALVRGKGDCLGLTGDWYGTVCKPDRAALTQLFSTRTQQREALVAELPSKKSLKI